MLRTQLHRVAASICNVNTFRSSSTPQLTALLQQCSSAGSWCGPASNSSSCANTSSSSRRQFADDAAGDVTEEVDAINEKFVEAREEIEYAREDAETVYFNESAEVARNAVGNVLERWQALLARVSEEEQAKLQRSMGLKIEQLKAELKELDEMHA